ncbi:type VII secretion protein EccB [Asanoa sp. WMMD1127]|uniref:type VII secretion protein EccB n=1 Tax=Asanoa sp. WMMD1127 TaxID=3016107 RepID=UPI002415EF65|nr:type VII secretion protein EccB [Asanoa sp. WMMD1127]MDG4825057.1 type VII secretion protein EccB [Asanoa sp. WMMD1127]
MPSRQQQLTAYQSAMRRVQSAFVAGDADALSPRRTYLLLAGVFVTAIIAAGVAVYGLTGAAVPTWRDESVLVIDRDTGSRYVYRAQLLRPVINYASARLILGDASVDTRRIPHRVLVEAAIGPPIGILGAPDEVPTADRLRALPWTVCRSSTGGGHTTSTAIIGTPVLPSAAPLAGGLLAAAGPSEGYLLWEGRRLRYDRSDAAVLAALGFAGITPVSVPQTFVDALPEGPALAAPAIPGAGSAGPRVGGENAPIGQLFQLSGEQEYYVLLGDGLARVAEPTYRLLRLRGTPGSEPRTITAAAVTLLSQTSLLPVGLPATMPEIARPADPDTAVVCAEHRESGDAQTSTTVRLLESLPAAVRPPPSGRPAARGTVDGAVIPEGRGALVRAANGDEIWLVDNQGVRYRVIDRASLHALGLGEAAVVSVAPGLIDALPRGPDLSRAAATETVSVQGIGGDPNPSPTPSAEVGR